MQKRMDDEIRARWSASMEQLRLRRMSTIFWENCKYAGTGWILCEGKSCGNTCIDHSSGILQKVWIWLQEWKKELDEEHHYRLEKVVKAEKYEYNKVDHKNDIG